MERGYAEGGGDPGLGEGIGNPSQRHVPGRIGKWAQGIGPYFWKDENAFYQDPPWG